MTSTISEERLHELHAELKAMLEAEFGKEGITVLWTAQNLTRIGKTSAAEMLGKGCALYVLPPWSPIINHLNRREAWEESGELLLDMRIAKSCDMFACKRQLILIYRPVADEGGPVAFIGLTPSA